MYIVYGVIYLNEYANFQSIVIIKNKKFCKSNDILFLIKMKIKFLFCKNIDKYIGLQKYKFYLEKLM